MKFKAADGVLYDCNALIRQRMPSEIIDGLLLDSRPYEDVTEYARAQNVLMRFDKDGEYVIDSDEALNKFICAVEGTVYEG